MLFHEDLHETVDSVNNMTLDDLLKLYEAIEIRGYISEAWDLHHEQESKAKENQPQ